MNHLGHLVLAVSHGQFESGLLTGGLLGDFVKGPLRGERPDDIEQGIALHRAIDAFSNRLPSLQRSAQRFGPDLRRLAPVLIDLVVDHFLTRDFRAQQALPLQGFGEIVLPLIHPQREWLTPGAARLLDRLSAPEGLAAYNSMAVIERSFHYIAQRLHKGEAAPVAMARLIKDYDGFAEDFQLYFPQLRHHAATWINAARAGS